MIKNEQMKIIHQVQIAHHIFELTLEGELVQEMKPGQFVHIKVGDNLDPLLRRPISIAKIDKETNQFTMIYRAEGIGTSVMSIKKVGDTLDVLGPLGNGFPIDACPEGGTALLVGGGIEYLHYMSFLNN